MTAAEFVHSLHGVRKSGDGYVAKCPGHDDKNPSLSVSDGDNGGVVLHCHSGCETDVILERMGLKLSDLMPPKAREIETRRKIAEHWYRDEKGDVLYVRERFSSGQKITQRRPDGTGWIYNLDGVERSIYRREKLATADGNELVFWVEGEKCVEALEKIGCVATTSGGAESWNSTHAHFLFGRDVVILPDNDEPGRKHAEAVLGGLTGKARSVRILELPLQDKGDDVVEWIEQGGTKEALLNLLAESQEGQFVDGKEASRRFIDHIERMADGTIAGIRGGIHELDTLIRGFRPSNLYIVCGETSNGKTLIGVHMAVSMAKAGARVGFVSLEMPLVEIETRFISHLTELSFSEVEDTFSCHEATRVARVLEAAKTRAALPISVLDGSGITVRQLVDRAREYKKQHDLDVLIVDYIQLLSDDSKRHTSREQEVTQISRGCQRLAKKEKIPVIVMAQLRRRDVRNEDHRPTLERLRESGSLEQDANAVVGVYWPHRYDEEGFAWHDAELHLLKNRNGKTGQIRVTIDWTCGRVS